MTWLDNSRILAVFSVVFLHTAAEVVIKGPIGTADWWAGNLYDSLVRWCVPVFVMISGALLLDAGKQEDMRVFYRKRLARILIPILFWSAVFLVWTASKRVMSDQAVNPADLAIRLLAGVPYYHMWFLYMIIPLYLFTPFLRKIIAASSRAEIFMLIVFAFVLAALNSIAVSAGLASSKLFINWFLPFIPCFALGYFVRTSQNDYSKYGLLLIFGTSVFLTALGCYVLATSKGLDAGQYFYDYLSITVIPMSVSVIFLLKRWKRPIGSEQLSKRMASLTLGVYLVHPIFLELIQGAGFGPLAFNAAVSIPLIAVVVFVLSLAVAWGINKIPWLQRVI